MAKTPKWTTAMDDSDPHDDEYPLNELGDPVPWPEDNPNCPCILPELPREWLRDCISDTPIFVDVHDAMSLCIFMARLRVHFGNTRPLLSASDHVHGTF